MVVESALTVQVIVVGILMLTAQSNSVRITRLAVPGAVLNQSASSITLDCQFQLDPRDFISSQSSPSIQDTSWKSSHDRWQPEYLTDYHTNNEEEQSLTKLNSSHLTITSGLVVKWFFNSDTTPVYQWIAGRRPQAMGVLKDRVDLNRVPDPVADPSRLQHQTVHVHGVDTDLSGEYTCRVSTWSDVASATKRMIVYEPATSMSLWSTEPRDHMTQITCMVNGIFPLPEVSLIIQDSQMSRRRLHDVHVTSIQVNGAYHVTIRHKVDDRRLPSQCMIYCRAILPNTGYSVTEKILHIRGTSSHSSTPFFSAAEKRLGRPLQQIPGVLLYSSSGANQLLTHTLLIISSTLLLIGRTS